MPEYVCSCCGYANGDMFEDYIHSNANKLTYAEVIAMCDEFDELMEKYHRQDEQALIDIRLRKPIK